jgi:hypothetical protein
VRLLNENLTTDLTDNTDFLSEIPLVRVVCGLFFFLKVNAYDDWLLTIYDQRQRYSRFVDFLEALGGESHPD